MPFNVWCLGCNNHVAMGVRYNAEKKRCGMYYTTPLFEFRMKCHLCDNYFTIRTDPKNFDYELVEGCRRQERRFDPSDIDNLGAVDRNFQQKLAGDAMFKAEHQKDDKAKQSETENQIEKLERIKKRDYDAYGMNCALRKQFRFQKKVLNEARAADEDLKQRLSLNIDLMPASSEDKTIAGQMMAMKDVKSLEQRQQEARDEIQKQSIFHKPGTSSASSHKRGKGLLSRLSGTKKSSLGVDLSSFVIRKKTKVDNENDCQIVEMEEDADPGPTLKPANSSNKDEATAPAPIVAGNRNANVTEVNFPSSSAHNCIPSLVDYSSDESSS